MAPSAEFGFGIVGCGNIFPTHAQALQRIPRARLLMVCDLEEAKARAAAEKYGCEWTTDYSRLLARQDVQVVEVLTWSGNHAELGMQAARAGKHVIVTKPMDVSLDAIDALIETCGREGVVLGATHQFRSYPAYQQARRAVLEGWLGRLVLVIVTLRWFRSQEYYDSADWRGTWRWDGGGATMNQAVHYADLLQWIGGEVESVAAHIATLTHEIEVEDVASATVRFKHGGLGVLLASTSIYEGLPTTVEIHGERGNILVEGDVIKRWDVADHPAPSEGLAEGAAPVGATADPLAGLDEGVRAHVEQIGDVLRAIREGGTPALDGHQARKAVEVVLAVYESARRGEAVSLPLKGG